MIYSNYRQTFNPLDLSVDEYLERFTEPKQAIHIVGYFPEIDRSLNHYKPKLATTFGELLFQLPHNVGSV